MLVVKKGNKRLIIRTTIRVEGNDGKMIYDMTPEMAAALSYSHKCLEEGDESMAVDAYVEYKALEHDYFIRTIGDRELEEMGR